MFKFEMGEIVGYDGLNGRKNSFGFITDRRHTGRRTSYLVRWFHNQGQSPFIWFDEQQLFKVSDV